MHTYAHPARQAACDARRRTLDMTAHDEARQLLRFAASDTIEEVANVLLPLIAADFDADCAQLLAVHPLEATRLVLPATAEWSRPSPKSLPRPRLSSDDVRPTVYEVHPSLTVGDLTVLTDLSDQLQRQRGVKCVAALPLLSPANELVGLLVLASGNPEGLERLERASEREQLRADLSHAVDKVRRQRHLEREHRHARALATVTAALADMNLQHERATQVIADAFVDATGAVCVLSRLPWDGSSVAAEAVAAADPSVQKEISRAFLSLSFGPATAGLTAEAIRQHAACRVSGGVNAVRAAMLPQVADAVTRVGIGSALALPMRAEGQVVGALTLMWTDPELPTDADDIALLQDVADRAGLVLLNTTLHAAITATQRRFQAAFDDAPVGMVMMSLAPGHIGEYSQINPAFARMLGYPAADLLGRTNRDVSHPDDLEADGRAVADLLSGAVSHLTREKRYVRADGETIWVRLTVSFVRPEDGAPYCLTHAEDITTRRRAPRYSTGGRSRPALCHRRRVRDCR